MSEQDSGAIRPGIDVPDADVAETFAEAAGVDPTHDDIDRYLEMEGDEPLGEERPLDEPGA